MNFKTKVAYSAVLATLGMAAGSAQAAYLSETGTGQVLLYPYYTVQGGYDTYLSVVNTTSRAKAVKVRFIEAKASREVLDFNLYLSAQDVWTGAVTATADGAQLVTNDKSCTAPQITGAVAFRNGAYIGAGDDILEDDLSRTREGYIEIIEMGDLGAVVAPVGTTPGNFAWRVTHATSGANAGVPNDCAWVNNEWAVYGVNDNRVPTGQSLSINRPTGGLIGSATLINVAQGVDYSYDPVAIEEHFTTSVVTDSLHYRPGTTRPSFLDATPRSTVVRGDGANQNRQVVITDWTGAARANVNAVSTVLMHSSIMNEYSVEPGINSGTDWVVTFPTKSFYVPSELVNVNVNYAPFTKPARTSSTSTVWAACEQVSMKPYDREERTPGGTIDFSPSTDPVSRLCWEANVITFNSSKVLGSQKVENNVNPGYQSGWMNLTFAGGQALVAAAPAVTTLIDTGSVSSTSVTPTYNGLPAVGFAVQKYVNGNVGGVLSNYGGSFIHKYGRSITGAGL